MIRALTFCLCLAVTAPALAAETITPSWMQVDESATTVTMDIVAGWSPDNGAMNYNGFSEGQMTVVVPVGWKVVIRFSNNDGDLPHSLVVTKPFADNEFPDTAGHEQTAIPRAYTRSPETGIESGQTDELSFTAKEPGQYYLYCGATGHGHGGMWDKLEISAEATLPHVLLADGAPAGFR